MKSKDIIYLGLPYNVIKCGDSMSDIYEMKFKDNIERNIRYSELLFALEFAFHESNKDKWIVYNVRAVPLS